MGANINAGQILANEDAIAQIIQHGETLAELVVNLVAAIRVLKQNQAAPATPAAPAAAAAPIHLATPAPDGTMTTIDVSSVDTSWMKTDAASMENYDAEQLVAIRKALAAGLIEDVHGIAAAVLERRLGSSKP